MREITNEAVRAALDDCLSGVQTLPSVRADVLNQVRGDIKVKKKLSVGIIFAMLLTLLMAGAALAAGLGLFGQIGERMDSDARLPGLERVSDVVGATFTTADGVTVTIDQAYYDGTRVFISYTKSGPFEALEMGEGKPENLGECDWELPGEKFGDTFFIDGPAHQAIAAHLNVGEPRWATRTYVNIHDGLQAGETYLDIIGGDSYLTEDGTMVGWKECVVPEEIAADELTVSLGTFTTCTTYVQDDTGLYQYYADRPAAVWHEFKVQKDASAGTALTGEASGQDWSARATLTASAIDVKGEIVLKCPQSWVEVERTWENPDQIDYIRDWTFYVGGEKVDDWAVQGINPSCDQQLVYDIGCRLDGLTQEMKLVPVYGKSGERMDEAIVLTVAE